MDAPSPSRRRHRLTGSSDFSWHDPLSPDRAPWRAIVSSRLGRNLLARQSRLSAVYHFAAQAQERRDLLLLVPETAAYSWAKRSAELLGASTVSPQFSGCRDTFSVHAADIVDAVYVRRGGKLEAILKQRLTESRPHDDEMVRVLLTGDEEDETARELMSLGAVGVFRPASTQVQPLVNPVAPDVSGARLSIDELQSADRWLIHSTRARSSAWPGESESQFIDSLLLSPPTIYQPSPLETLQRIVSQQRLVGTHRTNSSSVPVVSFTSLIIGQWLARRVYRPHLGRWDAEPYGIAIERRYAESLGIAPVIYGDQQTLNSLPTEDRWRFQAAGETYDWTSEQEWRAKGVVDLSRLPVDAVRVFVATGQAASVLHAVPWKVVVVQ